MNISGRKFVLVGGAGLIGSHTLDNLLREDVAEVVVFDNFSRGKLENISEALKDKRVKIYPYGGDILHADVLNSALAGADGVFHFAAMWLLHCHDFPQTAFEVNIRGTFNVINACVKSGVKRLVYSSSASVYGDAIIEPMDENHPFNNKTFYGATKIAGEALLRSYYYRYGLDYVGLRYMNVYGPRQDYEGAYSAVIVKMLQAIAQNHSPIINGEGFESYDFVAAADCGAANVCAMKSGATNEFYNVGTGKKTTLKELAELILELTGSGQQVSYIPNRNMTTVRSRVGSTAKAECELGFRAKINLRDGLNDLIRSRALPEI